jgi:uncharacterized protein
MEKGKQGFHSMDPDRQREIARLGAKAVHAKGTAHKWDSKSAALAGKLGGQKRKKNDRQMQAA